MINREIISQVKNQLRILNADYKLPNKFIWSIIDKHCKWLIKRDSDRMRLMRNNTIFQKLKCVEIIDAPTIDDCCGIRSRCSVKRTKDKLPPLYEDSLEVLIKNVKSIDGSLSLTSITPQQYNRKLEDPESKYDNNQYYYFNDGYLYFPKSKLRMVIVEGYFTEDIDKYNECEEIDRNPCKTKMDESFNLPSYLLGELMQSVLQDFSITRQMQDDGAIDKQEKNI